MIRHFHPGSRIHNANVIRSFGLSFVVLFLSPFIAVAVCAEEVLRIQRPIQQLHESPKSHDTLDTQDFTQSRQSVQPQADGHAASCCQAQAAHSFQATNSQATGQSQHNHYQVAASSLIKSHDQVASPGVLHPELASSSVPQDCCNSSGYRFASCCAGDVQSRQDVNKVFTLPDSWRPEGLFARWRNRFAYPTVCPVMMCHGSCDEGPSRCQTVFARDHFGGAARGCCNSPEEQSEHENKGRKAQAAYK